MSLNLKENLDRINNLARELDVGVRFSSDFTEIIVENRKPNRKRVRHVTDLNVENLEKAMYWVAEKDLQPQS